MSHPSATGPLGVSGRSHFGIWALVMLGALATISVASVALGTPNMSLSQVLNALHGNGTSIQHVLIIDLRLPRLAVAILAGAALATSGVVLQDSLRNPLAGPELLGVSAGAGVVVATIVVFHLPVPFAAVPFLALTGGLICGGSVVALTIRCSDPLRTVLLGAAVSALLAAVITGIVALGRVSEATRLFSYLLGGLSGETWADVELLAPFVVAGLGVALVSWRRINLLQLDDDVARGLGLNVTRTRLALMALSAVMVGAVVAVAGPIPYVALLAPHLARRMLGSVDARLVIPTAALLGAALLPIADLVGRKALSPVDIPVGVWLTLLGVPVFLWVIRHERGALRR